MRWIALCPLLVLSVLATAEGRPPRTTLRAHLEANSHDGPVFSSSIRTQSGREITIQKTPALSEHDVVAMTPYRANDGTFGALLQLDAHGQLALDTLSVERRGTHLHIYVNGRPVSEMLIDQRVKDGKLYLPSGLTAPEIAQMQKDWPTRARKK